MSPGAVNRPESTGGKLREISGVADPALATARAELAESERAREGLARQLHELTATAGATREQLTARVGQGDVRIAELLAGLESAESQLVEINRELSAAIAERDRAVKRLAHEQDSMAGQRERLELELSDAYEARARAAAELAPLSEALRNVNRVREQAEAENRGLETQIAELNRRLSLRGEELASAIGRLASIEGTIAPLGEVIAVLRSEATELRSERNTLAARVDALAIQNDGLTRAITERDRTISDHRADAAEMRAELEHRLARVQGLESELGAANIELEALRSEREATAQDLRRVAASHAWRWGHGVAKLLRRLTFRRARGPGAIQRMIANLEAPPVPPQDTKTSEPEPS